MVPNNLVLVPGLASDATLWAPTIAALCDCAHCSVGNTLEDATLSDMARRVVSQAPPTFALAGVSMGGMVALEIMALAPERVTHLALIYTAARPDTVLQRARRHLANTVIESFGQFDRLAKRSIDSLVHPSASDSIRTKLAAMTVRIGSEAFIRQNRAIAARRDLRVVLAGITVPTLVIVGQNDRTAPPALSREINALVPGSTLHIVADCGHLPPFEQPQITATLLRHWLTTEAATKKAAIA